MAKRIIDERRIYEDPDRAVADEENALAARKVEVRPGANSGHHRGHHGPRPRRRAKPSTTPSPWSPRPSRTSATPMTSTSAAPARSASWPTPRPPSTCCTAARDRTASPVAVSDVVPAPGPGHPGRPRRPRHHRTRLRRTMVHRHHRPHQALADQLARRRRQVQGPALPRPQPPRDHHPDRRPRPHRSDGPLRRLSDPVCVFPGCKKPPASATSTTSSPTSHPTKADHPAKPTPTTSPHSAEDTTAPRPTADGHTDASPTAATAGPPPPAAPSTYRERGAVLPLRHSATATPCPHARARRHPREASPRDRRWYIQRARVRRTSARPLVATEPQLRSDRHR